LSCQRVYDDLKRIFMRDGRDMIFNKMLEKVGVKINSNEAIDELVEVYRNHEPNIYLYYGVEDHLARLKDKRVRLGLLTDGMPIMQKNKVHALGLDRYFDEIVYSWEIGC